MDIHIYIWCVLGFHVNSISEESGESNYHNQGYTIQHMYNIDATPCLSVPSQQMPSDIFSQLVMVCKKQINQHGGPEPVKKQTA